MKKPRAYDLMAGLGGWTEGLLAEGFSVVGFDIERHAYGEHRYPAQLVLQDVRTIHGAQLKDAALIVASPPCQEYSYMAMPWTRAKNIAAEYRSGVRDVTKLTELFDACFRIQREAIEAAGHFIPLVVENVRGAIPWVGRSRWNYGSFHLWGDVPALMPITAKAVKVRGYSGFDGGVGFNVQAVRQMKADDAVKVGGARGDDWFAHHNRPEFEERATKNEGGSWFNVAHNTTSGKGRNPVNRQISKAWRDKHYDDTDKMMTAGGSHDDGVKGFTPHGQPLGKNELGRKNGSKSNARKAASARIAKIPLPLARHIAKAWYPKA